VTENEVLALVLVLGFFRGISRTTTRTRRKLPALIFHTGSGNDATRRIVPKRKRSLSKSTDQAQASPIMVSLRPIFFAGIMPESGVNLSANPIRLPVVPCDFVGSWREMCD
jgi:hypothetical protein